MTRGLSNRFAHQAVSNMALRQRAPARAKSARGQTTSTTAPSPRSLRIAEGERGARPLQQRLGDEQAEAEAAAALGALAWSTYRARRCGR